MQSTILVVRFGSLGDVVLTSATVLNLKLAYPGSRLVYLTKERFRPVVELFDGVDEIVTVSEHASARELFAVLLEIDKAAVDIVVDLHGNFRSWLARSIVTANRKGIYPKRRRERWQATRKKKTIPGRYPHTIDLYNDTVTRLGQTVRCRRPLLRQPQLADEHQHLFATGCRVVLIAPGAAHPNKAWPADRFVEVARVLRDVKEARIVWAVTSAETDRLSDAGLETDSEIIKLVDCPINQLAGVIAHSDLVVVNDSGVGHLASAVGTPVLAVFGPTHPVLGFAPRGLHDRVIEVDEPCRPCSLHGKKACYRDKRHCFTRISSATVAEAAIEMLDASADLAPGLFVDRDGTLIVNKHYLSDPDGVELIDGSTEAMCKASDLGYRIVIVSNQSGVARGYHSPEDVERVNARLLELLAIRGIEVAGVYFCPHHDRKGQVVEYSIACDCRKPSPGMAEEAALDLGIDLRKSAVVGDSLADIGLGRVIGARSILVRTGYGEQVWRGAQEELERDNVPMVNDLRQAVSLLAHERINS